MSFDGPPAPTKNHSNNPIPEAMDLMIYMLQWFDDNQSLSNLRLLSSIVNYEIKLNGMGWFHSDWFRLDWVLASSTVHINRTRSTTFSIGMRCEGRQIVEMWKNINVENTQENYPHDGLWMGSKFLHWLVDCLAGWLAGWFRWLTRAFRLFVVSVFVSACFCLLVWLCAFLCLCDWVGGKATFCASRNSFTFD